VYFSTVAQAASESAAAQQSALAAARNDGVITALEIERVSGYYSRGACGIRGGSRWHSARSARVQHMTHDLKSAGLKATLPRLKIINLFETSKVRHMTAEDVYKQLLGEGLDIGLATVYRVLTQFEQAGLLVRHHFESGKAVFELNEGKHHAHLVCLQCGRVEEFYDPEIEKRQVKVAKDRGFAITEHALYLYADCTKMPCPYKKSHDE